MNLIEYLTQLAKKDIESPYLIMKIGIIIILVIAIEFTI